MMQRLMIQAEPELLESAKRRAAERGVSVAQIVREAIGRELGDGPGRASRVRRSWLPRGELVRRLAIARADPGLREDLARLAGETTDDLGPLA